MLKNVDPGLLRILATIVAGGLGVLAVMYPAQAVYFVGLGGGLLGGVHMRRPGDIPAAGVNVDDLPGSRS